MKGIIYFEDGSVFVGEGIGAAGTTVGELVFNTSMTGYQEILTDPSYTGQIVTLTYPLIGNYGIEEQVAQSEGVKASGLIVRSANGSDALKAYLKAQNIVAISGVDTRAITKKIRNKGVMPCVMTTDALSVSEMQTLIENRLSSADAMKTAGTDKPYEIKGKGKKIAVMDFGIKTNILNSLVERGCNLKVYPYTATAEEILKDNPDGIFLSNGPGDPAAAVEAVSTIQTLVKEKPVFGICMGHQLLAKAFGAETYKMHYGHRGGNHGVYDHTKNRAFITSQNHGYAVKLEGASAEVLEVTHINLNDGSVEGIRHKTLPVFSVQYHPEGAPGPNDSTYLFDDFMTLCNLGGTTVCR